MAKVDFVRVKNTLIMEDKNVSSPIKVVVLDFFRWRFEFDEAGPKIDQAWDECFLAIFHHVLSLMAIKVLGLPPVLPPESKSDHVPLAGTQTGERIVVANIRCQLSEIIQINSALDKPISH